MAALYTVDASVFTNAFNPREPGQADSQRLLALLQARAIPIIVPTLALPEVAAAIRRGLANAELARAFALQLRRLPHLVWVSLDETLAQQAVEVAAEYGLRGSGAVYAAVALRFGSVLVTLDLEQHKRVKSALTTCFPAEALKEVAEV